MEKLNYNDEIKPMSQQTIKNLVGSLKLILKNEENEKNNFPKEYYTEVKNVLNDLDDNSR